MIVSEKSNQNISDYIQLLFTKRLEDNKKQIDSSEKMRNSSNCIYDYAHSFFREEERVLFFLFQCAILVLFRKKIIVNSMHYIYYTHRSLFTTGICRKVTTGISG